MLKIKYLILLTALLTNTFRNAQINEIKREIPSITNLATTTALNAKLNEVKSKIPNITNLATTTTTTTTTTTAITAVENKAFNVNNLVKKTDYTKIDKKKILLPKNLIKEHLKILLQD